MRRSCKRRTINGVIEPTSATDTYFDSSASGLAAATENVQDAIDELQAVAGDVSWTGVAAVDNAITRFHGTSGNIIQSSMGTLDDTGVLSVPTVNATTAYQLNGAMLEPVRTDTSFNLAAGDSASLGTGIRNVALGYQAAKNLTGGDRNVAVGYSAGSGLRAVDFNVCVGASSGTTNTHGNHNTLLGAYAKNDTNSLSYSVAIGSGAINDESNHMTIGGTTATNRIAAIKPGYIITPETDLGTTGAPFKDLHLAGEIVGAELARTDDLGTKNISLVPFGAAPTTLTTGSTRNTLIGYEAGVEITTENDNTMLGSYAGNGSTGESNTYVGASAGIGSLGAAVENNNTGVGKEALADILGGTSNTSLGYQAGRTIVAGIGSTSLGSGADPTADHNYSISLGFNAKADNPNVMMIGSDTASTTVAIIKPGVDNTCDLGSASNKFKDIYMARDLVMATAQTPASAVATGVKGTIAWDTGYVYVCTATNSWKRVALGTW